MTRIVERRNSLQRLEKARGLVRLGLEQASEGGSVHLLIGRRLKQKERNVEAENENLGQEGMPSWTDLTTPAASRRPLRLGKEIEIATGCESRYCTLR